jgi:hypothetical protein
MLDAARTRFADQPNVEVRQVELETLPIKDRELDAAFLSLVLHYSPDPARTLRRGCTCLPARREGACRRHAAASSRGISAADGPCVARVFREADREASDQRRIRGCAGAAAAVDSDAKGPALFAAIATKTGFRDQDRDQ